MPREDAITVEGELVEVLAARLFRVRLPNGHQVLAHPRLRDAARAAGLTAGARVKLEMTPFDLSKGCLVFEI